MSEAFHIFDDNWEDCRLLPLSCIRTISPPARVAAERGDLTFALLQALEVIAGWCAVPTSYSPGELPVDLLSERLAATLPRIFLYQGGTRGCLEAASQPDLGGPDLGAWCFGFGGDCFIKLECDGDSVASIWFEASTSNPRYLEALRGAFEQIDAIAPSVVYDHRLQMAGVVAQGSFLANYLRALGGRVNE